MCHATQYFLILLKSPGIMTAVIFAGNILTVIPSMFSLFWIYAPSHSARVLVNSNMSSYLHYLNRSIIHAHLFLSSSSLCPLSIAALSSLSICGSLRRNTALSLHLSLSLTLSFLNDGDRRRQGPCLMLLYLHIRFPPLWDDSHVQFLHHGVPIVYSELPNTSVITINAYRF